MACYTRHVTGPIKPVDRVLFFGVDGATWTNLVPLADRGEMPTLRKLMAAGAWGVLDSTIPALTPPAWASLITGTNPGKHGIYHFRHTPPGDYYQRRLNTSQDIHSPTIWQQLNQHGKRVGVMNVPLSHPVYPVDGFMTTDAFAPDTSGVKTYPPELASLEFKDYIVDVVNYPGALPGTAGYAKEMLAFIEENERVLLSQADTALRLMRSQQWQFFMVAWMATDRLGHYCWKYSDPALEQSLTTDEQKRLAARCQKVYRQIDSQIARLMEASGSDCLTVIASDHGFGPSPSAFFHTNRWLLKQGLLKLLPPWHWKRASLGYLPRSVQARLGAPIDAKFALVDWQRTRVWADPLEARAVAIRINRAGRYPHGIVPESESESLLTRLTNELSGLKTADGQKVVSAIHRGEILFHGPYAVTAPDLVVILEKQFDVPPSFRRDVRANELVVPNRHVLRDGGHEPEGVFLLHGPNICPVGRLPAQPIISITPTILAAMGLPISDDTDGEPIIAAFASEFLNSCPPNRESERSGPAIPLPPSQPEYSEEDSAKIEERLRKLGYLD
jgi:predicted AlkP superfamily phosphohydrolase/phosphomutase